MCETDSSISWMQCFTCCTDGSKSLSKSRERWGCWRQMALSLPDSVPLWGFPTHFSQCFSWSIWLMPWIFLPGLCHIFYFSLLPLHTYSYDISWSPILKYPDVLLDKSGYWSVVTSDGQLLQVNAAQSNILPSKLNIWNLFLSTFMHASTLVIQLQHSIQLSGCYHCMPEP